MIPATEVEESSSAAEIMNAGQWTISRLSTQDAQKHKRAALTSLVTVLDIKKGVRVVSQAI